MNINEVKNAADCLLGTNQEHCETRLKAAMSEDKRAKGAVIKLYLENFKLLNDTFGREYGDLLLNTIVQYLMDESGGEVYRSVGVEFIIVMPNASYSKALSMTERVGRRFEDVWRINGIDCLCTVFLAVAFYPGAAQDAAGMLSILDQTLNEALRQGTADTLVYDSALQMRLERKRRIALSLRDNVNGEGLEIRFRPTYCTTQKRVTRAECYLRLFVEGIGPVGAGEFLPIAEESGQICAIDRYAIDCTCQMIARLCAAGCTFESIAVPVSPMLLLQEGFTDEMQERIERYGIDPAHLSLEVTESVLVTACLAVGEAMQELADLGIELVLTDFGTGYSGISNILSLPVNVVKLERLFIWQLETEPKSGVLIEGLISIAHKLGLKLIAEGVETDNQVSLLDAYDCRYRQGFYYSATVDEAELSTLLAPSSR